MRKTGYLARKAMVTAVAAGLLLPGTVQADSPMEELSEIMEEQQERASESLLKRTLGLDELSDEMEDHGVSVQLKAGLAPGTAQTLDIQDEIPEDGYVQIGFQLDPKQKAWLLQAGANTGEESLIDLALYGDCDQLALSIPQFYTGALALGAGNLKEQYEQSALAQIIGDIGTIPDLDLSFYPEEDAEAEWEELFENLEEEAEDRVEEFHDSIQVEKEMDGDTTIYKATVSTKDIMELYSAVLTEYCSALEATGAVNANGTDPETGDPVTFDDMINSMTEQMQSVLGEEGTMEVQVRDNLVQAIHYELYCDTTELQQAGMEELGEAMTELVEEELAPAGSAENAAPSDETETEVEFGVVIGGADGSSEISLDAEPFQGVLSYDIVYWDPTDVSRGFYLNMTATDQDENEVMGCYLDWTSTQEDTTESNMLYLEVSEDGEIIYDGIPFYSYFDAESGDYSVTLSLTDSESGEDVAIYLYSNFSRIEKGKSFLWTINELGMEANGEQIGLTGELQVAADPGVIEKPQESRMILELSQEELTSLAQEISLKAALWSSQLEGSDAADEAETEAAAGENLVL